ncbi:O-succinylbenzoic acid--CoA ligase [Friedmanniella luteola]|uniref:O-succinylbenzoic acid--CoA ligase n=1 Tax=Friedmanniella luteola TaxID=546871 RepID=A0A1H1Z9T5_9ACTN|nr:AMP-binding protein [Friedmanniella luteola]SDT30531.1 O-succinylbenzoic acid--CoA ligase [Friedmanniella luteola]
MQQEVRGPGSGGSRLRLVEAPDLPTALADALAGGRPVAPLPPAPLEQQQAREMLAADQPLEEGVAVVVSTSGSTGRPKGVLLSAAAVVASARATEERLGGPGDWALALPPHYVAGLMVLARAQLGGTRAHPAAGDLADLPAVVARMEGRRYLSVVPTQLARALPQPAVAGALAGFDAVLVGGGPLPPALAAAAGAAGVRVVTTYGMSETCGGCVYDGVPLAGVDVALAEDGRVSLGGPVLFAGYRGRPELTAEAVVDGRLRTADRARWLDGRLVVLGRVDDVVVSGGLNVDLAEVERRLRGWPGLAGSDVVVVGVPDPDWGTAVVAVVERADWSDADTAAVRAHLRDDLPAYATPRRVLGRGRLPRTSSGKIDRLRLVAGLSGSGHAGAPTTGDA